MQVEILGDLQGPKIRISSFKNGSVTLINGDDFTLDQKLQAFQGDKSKVGIEYKNLTKDLIQDDILLLDDGKIKLQVKKVYETKILTKIISGGQLSDKKGINKLGGGLSASALTEKDKRDIMTAAEISVDYLAISFPRDKSDLDYARSLAKAAKCKAQVIAKIERAEVVKNEQTMQEVICAADGVMVARGDLAVEIGNPRLVETQKKNYWYC